METAAFIAFKHLFQLFHDQVRIDVFTGMDTCMDQYAFRSGTVSKDKLVEIPAVSGLAGYTGMEQPGIPCLHLCNIFLHFLVSINVTVIDNGIRPFQVSHVRIAFQSCVAYPYFSDGIRRTGQELYISAVGEHDHWLSCQRRICIDTKPCT